MKKIIWHTWIQIFSLGRGLVVACSALYLTAMTRDDLPGIVAGPLPDAGVMQLGRERCGAVDAGHAHAHRNDGHRAKDLDVSPRGFKRMKLERA